MNCLFKTPLKPAQFSCVSPHYSGSWIHSHLPQCWDVPTHSLQTHFADCPLPTNTQESLWIWEEWFGGLMFWHSGHWSRLELGGANTTLLQKVISVALTQSFLCCTVSHCPQVFMACEQGAGTNGATQNAQLFKGAMYFLFVENCIPWAFPVLGTREFRLGTWGNISLCRRNRIWCYLLKGGQLGRYSHTHWHFPFSLPQSWIKAPSSKPTCHRTMVEAESQN